MTRASIKYIVTKPTFGCVSKMAGLPFQSVTVATHNDQKSLPQTEMAHERLRWNEVGGDWQGGRESLRREMRRADRQEVLSSQSSPQSADIPRTYRPLDATLHVSSCTTQNHPTDFSVGFRTRRLCLNEILVLLRSLHKTFIVKLISSKYCFQSCQWHIK